MKKNIILACFCAAIGFSACDNYLDITPKGQDKLSKTKDYLGLLEVIDNSFSIDDFGYTTDEVTWPYRRELEGYAYRVRSANFFYNEEYDRASNITNDQSTGDLYKKCYYRISRYNILIDNMKDAEGPESEKTLGLAQAKAGRAYNYFFLLNTFAKPYNAATAGTDRGIILRKKFELEIPGKQYTIAEGYDFILQDLNEAIGDLPEKAANVLRADKAFGYAFRAKVHLFMRNFDDALKDALEALKFSHHELWDISGDFAKYVAGAGFPPTIPPSFLFPMYINGVDANGNYFFSHPMEHSENLFYAYSSPAGHPCYLRKPIADLFVAIPGTDLRYNFIATPAAAHKDAEPGAFLLSPPPSKIYMNDCGMRLSEVYLMVAECYARKGEIDLALKYLNDLRKTRIMTTDFKALTATDINNDKDKALTLVRQERTRKFIGGCNGFFDLRRFCTEFNETLTKTYTDTKGETHTYILKPDSHLLTFPFPVPAMQNSDLIQNSK